LSTLAVCAALGLAAAGCQGSHGSQGSNGSQAGSATGSGPSTARTAAPARQVSGGALTGLAEVYVVADCAAAPPYPLSREPLSITLACADAGIGVRDMIWMTWTAKAATGSGLLWEKLCVPDCATGKIGYYPVDVTLSAVRASARGQWFSALTVSWQGSRPPNKTPDTFTLMPPAS
jgi:hypothetical protein